MRRGRVMLAALFCAITLAACEPALETGGGTLGDIDGTEATSDIARTFDNAMAVIPGARGEAPTVGRLNGDEVQARLRRGPRLGYPTVLYLHGCNGYGTLKVLEELGARGFAVIAPDSFARRYRPLQCSAWFQSGGQNVFVYDFRLTEVAYTLHRLKQVPWVDPNRLFLYGSSEGAVAAALYRGYQFKARVLTHWTCHGSSFVRGLSPYTMEPVLALVGADDPWYAAAKTAGQQGHCGVFFAGRPRSRSLVLDGVGHAIYDDPRNVTTIADFLAAEAGRISAAK